MQVGVMITNGANFHAPEYHAEVTAAKIVDIAESASAEKHQAARAMRKKVEKILLGHHTKVHDNERARWRKPGLLQRVGLMSTPAVLDSRELIDDQQLIREIVSAAAGTVLEPHFNRADVQQAILAELHHETRSQMQVHLQAAQREAEGA